MSRSARLGLFILFTLAILIAGVFIIGSNQYLFSSTYQLKTTFQNVEGLAPGADVQVGGVHSGIVRKIELPQHPGQLVTVYMDLNKSTHSIIKQDSIATIQTEGLLGSQYMAISFGSADKGDVKNGDTIASTPPIEISDIIAKANGILDTGEKATQNLTAITGKINTGQGTAGALVNNKELYQHMNNTIAQAQAGVTDFQENMEALKHNFFLSGFFKKRGYEDAAQLTANAITKLPTDTPIKTFTFSGKQLFDKLNTAKLKDQKALKETGDYLANNHYGYAVIAVATGMTGDTQQDLTLSEARAMVLREALVTNYGFDDQQLKTLGLGKQPDAHADPAWGTVQILIYPVGATLPAQNISSNAAPAKTAPAK